MAGVLTSRLVSLLLRASSASDSKSFFFPCRWHLSSSSPSSHPSALYSLQFQNLSGCSIFLDAQPTRAAFLHRKQLYRASEYAFPDPIPEFADSETAKFKAHMLKRLSKKEIFGDSFNEVVEICTEIFSNFLHNEYGGPGTLLVVPFIDMADTVNQRGLPGGSQAARSAVVWAQKHVDKDWNAWTGGEDEAAEQSLVDESSHA